MNDACIDFAGVESLSCMVKDMIKAMEDVYQTPLFQSIIFKVQKSFKDPMDVKPENYEKLRKAYHQYTILPEEFAVDFLKY